MSGENITGLIGNTPLLELEPGLYVKLEGFNPGGSVKDRIALAMLEDAWEQGKIKPDTIIIEATSGNTGIGLAMAAAAMKLKLVLVMPDTMSMERRQLLRAYGATLELTPGAKGMKGAIGHVHSLLAADNRYLHLDQFSHPANPRVHYETSGPEILKGLTVAPDALVCGVGTGGTITGAGKFLKEHNPNLLIVAVEPELSPVLSGGQPGPHPIQGIGPGFVPEVLDTSLLDRIITVSGANAQKTTRLLASENGILAGISSGAALWAAREVKKELGSNKTVVTVAPDTGERYLSTNLFLED